MTTASSTTTSGQYIKYTLEKCAFWHGILSINDTIITSFFDIKVKKDGPDPENIAALYTTDLPAYPVNVTDNVHVVINIENNIGTNTSHIKIVEANFLGSELTRQVEELPPQTNTIEIKTESGEWQFSLQEGKTWIIRGIVLYAPLQHLRKYVKEN